VIIIACVENEHYPTPSIVAVLLAVIYWKAIVSVPWSQIAIVVGAFALLGAGWSTFQWFRRVQKKAAFYREKYGEALTEGQLAQLKEDVSASRHKALITGWIAFWPWDMFWTFTGDFFNMIYEALSNVYQGISNRAVGQFKVAEKVKEKEDAIPNDEMSYRRGRSY
jgi:hypothetical protein